MGEMTRVAPSQKQSCFWKGLPAGHSAARGEVAFENVSEGSGDHGQANPDWH
jgi:hypothetical protein